MTEKQRLKELEEIRKSLKRLKKPPVPLVVFGKIRTLIKMMNEVIAYQAEAVLRENLIEIAKEEREEKQDG